MQDLAVTPHRKYLDNKFFIFSLFPVFPKILFKALDSSKLQNAQREGKRAVI